MLYRSAKKSRKKKKKKKHPTSKVYLRYVQYFICMMAGVMAAGSFFRWEYAEIEGVLDKW